MRFSLFLLLSILGLVSAQVYIYNITSVPPSGFFTPLLSPSTASIFVVGRYGPDHTTRVSAVCDGRFLDHNEVISTSQSMQLVCSTFQAVLFAVGTSSVSTPLGVVLNVTQYAGPMTIMPDQTYVPSNPVIYVYNSSTPFYTYRDYPIRDFWGFSWRHVARAGESVQLTTYSYPYYATSLPESYVISYTGDSITAQYQDRVCSKVDALLLSSRSNDSSPHYISAQSCGYEQAYSYDKDMMLDLIPAGTPPTVSIKTSGDYTLQCQSYGNVNAMYALVNFRGVDMFYTNIHVFPPTRFMGTMDSSVISTVFYCGGNSTRNVSVTVVPATNILVDHSYDAKSDGPTYDNYTISPGFIRMQHEGLNIYGPFIIESCPITTTTLLSTRTQESFAACSDVTGNKTQLIDSYFTILFIKPPAGYCLVGSGYPDSPYMNAASPSTNATVFTDTYTVTCDVDHLAVQSATRNQFTLKFVLVSVQQGGVYGKQQEFDALLILEYPAVSSLSVASLVGLPSSNFQFNPPQITEYSDPAQYNRAVGPNSPKTSNILVVAGNGPFVYYLSSDNSGTQWTTQVTVSTSQDITVSRTTTYSGASQNKATLIVLAFFVLIALF
ncbi:hypothetical protein PROFUN_03593 [Planoprotostelium fungivorum]|uniref:Uncharacterized protein n=1 Tax=Planoprotostelium fungivorum TaxID=1890364 RepID=A0A2P6MSI6_9EUKA|nr:hypothetical protein PROFUN_03593 [Planoprotostelium fungivorum]